MSEKIPKQTNGEHTSPKDILEEPKPQIETDKLSILEKAEQEHRAREQEREALEDAQDFAHSAEDKKNEEKRRATSPAERRRGAPSKNQLEKSFKAQIASVQTELDPTSRLLSKVIHTAPVEKISNAVGTTLARPNAMLSGSIAAFLSISVLYFVARYFGYRLSGFETVAAFAIGWLLGITFDYASRLFKSRR